MLWRHVLPLWPHSCSTSMALGDVHVPALGITPSPSRETPGLPAHGLHQLSLMGAVWLHKRAWLCTKTGVNVILSLASSWPHDPDTTDTARTVGAQLLTATICWLYWTQITFSSCLVPLFHSCVRVTNVTKPIFRPSFQSNSRAGHWKSSEWCPVSWHSCGLWAAVFLSEKDPRAVPH